MAAARALVGVVLTRDADALRMRGPFNLGHDEPRVHWLGLTTDRYQPVERSGLIELAPDELSGRIDWP